MTKINGLNSNMKQNLSSYTMIQKKYVCIFVVVVANYIKIENVFPSRQFSHFEIVSFALQKNPRSMDFGFFFLI